MIYQDENVHSAGRKLAKRLYSGKEEYQLLQEQEFAERIANAEARFWSEPDEQKRKLIYKDELRHMYDIVVGPAFNHVPESRKRLLEGFQSMKQIGGSLAGGYKTTIMRMKNLHEQGSSASTYDFQTKSFAPVSYTPPFQQGSRTALSTGQASNMAAMMIIDAGAQNQLIRSNGSSQQGGVVVAPTTTTNISNTSTSLFPTPATHNGDPALVEAERGALIN
jgi:hypothetical protein